MKTFLTKLSIIFSSIVLFIMILSNGIMLLISHKLSSASGFFAKLDVVNQYRVLHNMWFCNYSLLLNVALFATVLGLIIKIYLIKK